MKTVPEELPRTAEAAPRLDHPVYTVTTRALVKRINRKLAHQGQALRTALDRWEVGHLGHYYVIDRQEGGVLCSGIESLATFARELGAMSDWEIEVKRPASSCRGAAWTEVHQ